MGASTTTARRPPAPRATPTWTTCPSWRATATTPVAWRRSTKEGRSLRSDPVGIMYPECITSPLIPNPTKSYIPPPYILIMCCTVLFVLCLSVIRIGGRCEEENKTLFVKKKKKKKKKKS